MSFCAKAPALQTHKFPHERDVKKNFNTSCDKTRALHLVLSC